VVKKSKFSDYDSRNQVLVAINLKDDDEVVAVRQTNGESDLMMFTANGQGIRFSESDARPLGRASQGVRGIRLREGDQVVAAAVADEAEDVLLLTTGGYGKRTKMSAFRTQKRGGLGIKAMKLTKVRGTIATARAVTDTDEIVVTSSDGIVIRSAAKSISRQGRVTTGVKVMNLAEGATLSAQGQQRPVGKLRAEGSAMAVRRVRRIIRKIDPWTVLKVALVINAAIGLAWTLGVWVAWSIAVQRGIPDAFADLVGRLTIAFTPDGELYFRVVLMFGIIWVIGTTAVMTLMAVLYNLVSDIVGGVELIMLEETQEQAVYDTQQRPRPVVHVPADSGGSPMSSEETVEHV
jgi:hypothetical protein